MPEDLVREAVVLHGPTQLRLADRFDVSRAGHAGRLRWLGLGGHAGEYSQARPAY